MYRFTHNQKYMRILLAIMDGESKIIELSKKFDVNYQHLTIVMQSWQTKDAVIDMKREQNSYTIKLTEKGKEVAIATLALIKAMDKPKNFKGEENGTKSNTV